MHLIHPEPQTQAPNLEMVEFRVKGLGFRVFRGLGLGFLGFRV